MHERNAKNTEVISMKDGTYMLLDHVIRNGGKQVTNEGSWGNYNKTQKVTFNDMQSMCHHHSHECRSADLGKKVVSVIMPNEKPVFFCGFHYFMTALTMRFTKEGCAFDNTILNAHP